MVKKKNPEFSTPNEDASTAVTDESPLSQKVAAFHFPGNSPPLISFAFYIVSKKEKEREEEENEDEEEAMVCRPARQRDAMDADSQCELLIAWQVNMQRQSSRRRWEGKKKRRRKDKGLPLMLLIRSALQLSAF